MTSHDNLIAPPNSLRRMTQPEWHEQRVGSLATLNSMVVGTAIQSWLNLLTRLHDISLASISLGIRSGPAVRFLPNDNLGKL